MENTSKRTPLKFAVIDIEATGGNVSRTRMMEIGIVMVEGGQITDSFSTLINPGKKPDRYVQRLTGITPKMVARAPKFEQVAARILQMIEGSVLTAHNADFDYNLLRKEYARLGYRLQIPVLDTIDLSKHLIPGLNAYGLETLTQILRIPVTDRHRAFGDALATAEILKVLLQKDPGLELTRSLIRYPGKQKQKKHSKRVDWLLHRIGTRRAVLMLYDKENRLLYAGYAHNPRQKAEKLMATHPELMRLIHRCQTEAVPGRLIGRIIARKMARKHLPPYSDYRPVTEKVVFPAKNALLYDRGRQAYEQSVFVVRNGRLEGFAYIDLDGQATDFESLRKRLVPLDDCPYGRLMVMQHWEKGKFSKVQKLHETPAD